MRSFYAHAEKTFSFEVIEAALDDYKPDLGSLDAPDQLMPTYETWTIRREAWLPPFPVTRRYERDRDATSRFEA